MAKHMVRYSELYGDSTTAEWMFTAAVPVYDRTMEPPGFFGVVATDVLAEPIKDSPDFKCESFYENRKQSAVCSDLELTEETIERLRAETDSAGFGGDLGASCKGADIALILVGIFAPLAACVVCAVLFACRKNAGSAHHKGQAPVVIIQQQQPQAAPQQSVATPVQAPPSFQAPLY